MAIILQGYTTCAICKTILQEKENTCGFQAFIPNTKDKLYLFNDAGVHCTCLDRHPYAMQVTQFAEERHTKFMRKICAASGNVITDYHHHLFLPLLTSDETEELFQFNFLTMDKRNIAAWGDRERFVNTATAFIQQGKWGDYREEYKFRDGLLPYFR